MKKIMIICIFLLSLVLFVGCESNKASDDIYITTDEILEERIRNNSGNGGLAVQVGDKYFVSLTDGTNDAGLYCYDEDLKNPVMIYGGYEGYVGNLNKTENEVYFDMHDGEYRMDCNTLEVEKVFDKKDFSDDYFSVEHFYDGYFYATDSETIFRINADTKEVEELVHGKQMHSFTLYNNGLIYRDDSFKSIMRYDLETGKTTKIAKTDLLFGETFMYYKGELYCAEVNSPQWPEYGNLCRISPTGKKTIILENIVLGEFTVYEDKCYAEVCEDGQYMICSVNIDGSDRVKIYDDGADNLSVTGDRLFFTVSSHYIIGGSVKLDGSDLRKLNYGGYIKGVN